MVFSRDFSVSNQENKLKINIKQGHAVLGDWYAVEIQPGPYRALCDGEVGGVLWRGG